MSLRGSPELAEGRRGNLFFKIASPSRGDRNDIYTIWNLELV